MGDDLDRIIEAMQNTINEDTRAAWGEEAYQRWVNPPNMGAMPDADGTAELRGSCGDSMAISLKFDGGRVCAASFETDGCGPSVVCGSLAAEMAVGKTAEELFDITDAMVLARAGQIPEDHHHCAFLAVSTLHEALGKYMRLALEEK
jgi:NifU-like protein involved in Fe-S cluster formation